MTVGEPYPWHEGDPVTFELDFGQEVFLPEQGLAVTVTDIDDLGRLQMSIRAIHPDERVRYAVSARGERMLAEQVKQNVKEEKI